jgi:hypothetical protein
MSPSTRSVASRSTPPVKNRAVYRQLQNFQACIESNISRMKQAYVWRPAHGASLTTSLMNPHLLGHGTLYQTKLYIRDRITTPFGGVRLFELQTHISVLAGDGMSTA